MKRFALALLVMAVMALGFGLLTASAQTADNMVTVTVTDSNMTVSPNTVPVNVPVTFTITNNGQNAHAFVIEKAGDNNLPLTNGANTASFPAIAAGATFSTTWTFTDSGSYQIAAYNNGTLETGLVATFTVDAAQAATATASPTVEATATVTATAAITTTTVTTTTPTADTAATNAQSPTNLPTTGGESNGSALLLVMGVAALLLSGALTFPRRAR